MRPFIRPILENNLDFRLSMAFNRKKLKPRGNRYTLRSARYTPDLARLSSHHQCMLSGFADRENRRRGLESQTANGSRPGVTGNTRVLIRFSLIINHMK